MAVETASTTRTATRQERSGLLWLLRVTSTLQLLALIFQGVAAGEMMGGMSWGRSLHGTGATFVHVTGLLLLIAAIVLWRPGRGPGWPAWISALILLAGFAQSMTGGSGNLLVHVPLAMGLVVVATWLTGWSWSRRPSTGSGSV